MNILLINDDGYKSEITQNLKEYLVSLGHNVYSFLPETDYSGMGSSISFNKEIFYRQEKDREFVVTGTPVDCAILGIQYMSNNRKIVDIVVSGINIGLNLRQAIRYSGTTNAAKEALAYNIPSIALSAHEATDISFLKEKMCLVETIINFMHMKGRYKGKAFGINVNLVKGNKIQCDYEQKYTNMKLPLFYAEMEKEKADLRFNQTFKRFPESCILIDGFDIEDNEVSQKIIRKRIKILKKQVNDYLNRLLGGSKNEDRAKQR